MIWSLNIQGGPLVHLQYLKHKAISTSKELTLNILWSSSRYVIWISTRYPQYLDGYPLYIYMTSNVSPFEYL
ncbi:unnamed protein product [Callosobruchus maculatus]|uniref:Uncharacterized protein n=1 Tax=Callosobruchus maculatus TaxID=64391 RepID=A0A653C019_CALMS|nr:unnamed protein product [Callosobruchus maculatus]